jgi:hypothetical protein
MASNFKSADGCASFAGFVRMAISLAHWLLCRGDRCWNYSTQVGVDHEHLSLCERCAPVIRGMGFRLPQAEAAAEEEKAAVPL